MSFPQQFPANSPVVTITHPSPTVWVIELHNGEDNRLSQTMLGKGLGPALDAVEASWRAQSDEQRAKKSDEKNSTPFAPGALIIVGKLSQDKFFSNGFDFAADGHHADFFMTSFFVPVFTRLVKFPLPTVAAINGHCFAAGMALAMACDYRVMTDDSQRRVWMCMNEVHFGGTPPPYMAGIMRAKAVDRQVMRAVLTEGHRFTPAEAYSAGLVDVVVQGGGTQKVVQRALQTAEEAARHASTGVWGLIKSDVYRDVLDLTRLDARVIQPEEVGRLFKARL